MFKMYSDTYNGTGAAVYLCLGFIPDFVEITAVEDQDEAVLVWTRDHRAAETVAGFVRINEGGAGTAYTKTTGIQPYEGNELLTSSNQTSVAYGEGVYLKHDENNYAKAKTTFGGASKIIDKWTLGVGGSTSTGNFNDDIVASGSRIAEGSRILIEESAGKKQKWAVVEAVAGGAGGAANEVTISRPIASGNVLFISGYNGMIPIPVGETTPKGIQLDVTSLVNVDDEIQRIVAGTYTN